MEIKFAEKKDINDIVNLCSLHAAYEKVNFDVANKSNLLSKYLFDNQDVLKCLVIKENDNLVGYATFMKQFSTWDASFYLYLDCIFLTKKVRGKGLGTLLMKEIKAYAIKEKCSIIQWQTPSSNTKAINFYKKIGATSKNKERFFLNL